MGDVSSDTSIDIVSTAILEHKEFKKSSFQQKLHIGEGDEVDTRFASELHISSYSNHLSCQIASQEKAKSQEYLLVNNMDIISYVYLVVNIPQIKVKPEFEKQIEISWCHNLGHNITNNGTLKIGSSEFNLDNISQDINAEFYMKPGANMDKLYNHMIGNLPFLQKWGKQLPSWSLVIPQPWFFSESYSKGIPLFLCPENKQPILSYSFVRDISKLLRMRVKKEDGGYSYIKCNVDFLEKNGTLPLDVPVMWGKYSMLTEYEREYRLGNTKDKFGNPVIVKHQMEVNRFIRFRSENSTVSGKVATISVQTNTPVKGWYAVAQSEEAIYTNNHSNYTTNPYNIYENGWHPISHVNQKYATQTVMSRSSIHERCPEIWYHSASAPTTHGYLFRSHAYNIGNVGPDVGVTYSQDLGVKYLFTIDAKNPLESSEQINEENSKDAVQRKLDESVKAAKETRDSDIKRDQKFFVYMYVLTSSVLTFTGDDIIVDDGSQ